MVNRASLDQWTQGRWSCKKTWYHDPAAKMIENTSHTAGIILSQSFTLPNFFCRCLYLWVCTQIQKISRPKWQSCPMLTDGPISGKQPINYSSPYSKSSYYHCSMKRHQCAQVPVAVKIPKSKVKHRFFCIFVHLWFNISYILLNFHLFQLFPLLQLL